MKQQTPIKRIVVFQENVVYSIVTPDGNWHSRGDLGWFGLSFNEDSDWNTHFKEILNKAIKEYPDLPIFAIDYHI